MLSISEFSEMSHLSPQTLRFYHAEGLLMPAAVDERTGYRSYAFEQVEQAMLITVLRDAGMSVSLVREALDEPVRAGVLLDRHHDEVKRHRAAQDDAIQAARLVLDKQPESRLRHLPAMVLVTRLVPGTPLGRTALEWDRAESLIETTASELVTTLQEAGVTCLGRPWRIPVFGSQDQGRRSFDEDSPFWTVAVPVAASAEALATLPAGLHVREQDAGDEVSIFMPGRNTMAKYCTAILRLLHAGSWDDGTFVNVARLRQEVHGDGVLFGAPVERRPE